MEKPGFKILLYEKNSATQEAMITMFLENKFEVLAVQDRKKILANLRTGTFPFLVCDGNDRKAVSIINDIKNDSKLSQIHIVLHTGEPSPDFIEEMLGIGVCGIIVKPFLEAYFMRIFFKILQKIRITDLERRGHIRVVPDPQDKVKVELRSPKTFKLFTGNIANVSMGGMLCEFRDNNKEQLDTLAVNELVEHIRITLNEYVIITNALLIFSRSNYLAFHFQEIDREGKFALAKYIYTNLNS